MRQTFLQILFALSAVVPLLSGRPQPLWMYTLFVLAYFLRHRLTIARVTFACFFFAMFISTLLLEILAWLDNYFSAAPDPILFHNQLFPDLLIAVGFYLSWTLAWWLVLRRYRFGVREVFLVNGLYGVLIENQGVALLAGLQALPLGAVLWLYVLVAYGATAALAFLPFREAFSTERATPLKYPLAWALLFIFSFGISILWGFLIQGFLPPERPITEFPFF
jgi:hypothetical protein